MTFVYQKKELNGILIVEGLGDVEALESKEEFFYLLDIVFIFAVVVIYTLDVFSVKGKSITEFAEKDSFDAVCA